MSFPSALREKVLLWCDRRCCICKKSCDLLIEVHHIVPESEHGSDDVDNAIPLCFDCHAKVHFNDSQPIGSKYKPDELKKRRDQVYEEYTRHLVPVLSYRVIQDREPPHAGFRIRHTGNTPWVKVRVKLDIYLDGEQANNPNNGFYNGATLWNLNPGEGVDGFFIISNTVNLYRVDVRVGINIDIYDIYGRLHQLLPVTYVLKPESWDWYLDPICVMDSAQQFSQLQKDRALNLNNFNIRQSSGNIATDFTVGTVSPAATINPHRQLPTFIPGLTGSSQPIESR